MLHHGHAVPVAGHVQLEDESMPMSAPRLHRWRAALRKPVGREKGFALLVVAVTLAVLGALAEDFAYNTRVDLEAAANSRDQLRAEYLARSGIQLSRLLIKVQQSVLDRNRQYIGDIQIAEFAPYLIKAFGGEADERAGLGSLLGLDVSSLKGLGAGKGATFDLTMSSDDGRLNLNCGGGLNDAPHQQQMWAILNALFWPPRYSPPIGRVFDTTDSDGQVNSREDVARAVLDWADVDEARFDPTGASSGSEDYRYDGTRDPFRAHNYYYDSIEEVNLVRGVGDELWGSFGDMFTAYGGCKVNVGAMQPEHWPLMAAILRATVKDDHRNDPVLLDDVQLAGLAQQVLAMAKMTGGFQTTQQFIQMISDPANALTNMLGLNQPGQPSVPPPSTSSSQGLVGVPLDAAKVNNVITIGPRRIYRLDATGTIQRTREKRIQVHIRAIWDSAHFNQNTTSGDMNDRQGTWVYWRED
jgi:type II secretory pathway component PulK